MVASIFLHMMFSADIFTFFNYALLLQNGGLDSWKPVIPLLSDMDGSGHPSKTDGFL